MAGAAIERSEFDSEVFGLDFFRVAVPDANRVAIELTKLPQNGAVVDAKLDAGDFVTLGRFDALGFRRAATLVEFASQPLAGTAEFDVQRSLLLDPDSLDAHARGFRFQRFAQDSRLPVEKAVELMRRWITNSLAGRRETMAIGQNFCTYDVADGRLTIDLLSCIDRGRGMAAQLLGAIHQEAAARGCHEVRVTTEAENVTAMRVYMSGGFRPRAAYAAMHLVR